MNAKHQMVQELRDRYTIQDLCRYLKISRSGYYRYLKRRDGMNPKEKDLKEKIHSIYQQRKGTYGYRRIQVELQRQFGIRVNHKRVLRLMQDMGLKARIRRTHRHGHAQPSTERVAENLLAQNFRADAPNQKWVTDVSFIPVRGQWLYLSAIMDLFNNEIVAFQISKRNDNALVLQTVEQAVQKRKDVSRTILHSDRGFQYTSRAYHDMLDRVDLTPSMSRRGNCFDNACIESFFSHLKAEALYLHGIQDITETQRCIEEYIQFYNEQRIQRRLKKLTPVEYRRQLVA